MSVYMTLMDMFGFDDLPVHRYAFDIIGGRARYIDGDEARWKANNRR